MNNKNNTDDTLKKRIESYANHISYNDKIHFEFTKLTNTIPELKKHRDWVETNKWGFGDRAFHYMWFLILKDLSESFSSGKALEIGVFKGQVISLWELISNLIGWKLQISAISPFEGNMSKNRWVHFFKKTFHTNYREDYKIGNLHFQEDYMKLNRIIFDEFNLDFNSIEIIKGYSNDPKVVDKVKGVSTSYSLIYIDGDHSYENVLCDIKNYSTLIHAKGFLVMDDASYFLPGSVFFKGFESVSRACEILPDLGFLNVLNIGHNRIYQRIP